MEVDFSSTTSSCYHTLPFQRLIKVSISHPVQYNQPLNEHQASMAPKEANTFAFTWERVGAAAVAATVPVWGMPSHSFHCANLVGMQISNENATILVFMWYSTAASSCIPCFY
jgi:hypothetical protein